LEHLIRVDMALQRHLDYTHYNPVKHGYVKRAIDWPYPSFIGICVSAGWVGIEVAWTVFKRISVNEVDVRGCRSCRGDLTQTYALDALVRRRFSPV